jgi:hypothetical protein
MRKRELAGVITMVASVVFLVFAVSNVCGQCDTKCRQRYYFWYPNHTDCWQYDVRDCYYCVTVAVGANGCLTVASDPNSDGNCQESSFPQGYYDGTTSYSPCPGAGILEVLTCNNLGNHVDYDFQMVCNPKPSN